ncbi:MAG: alpha/beta fold hydrolase [Actinomycetota bacterium]|nr:alpha/beta fold hydrolase [Acidimicrobiia bacterium]MDQ3470072.1 alpha/beta fold hydrolase [Actinomycetota bacterium]
MQSTPEQTPVVLVHGWGGSFEATWRRSGFTDLLADAGRTVIGVDLLGHGDAPKPHDPQDYADLTERIADHLPPQPVDAVGFSLGAFTLLELAVRSPERFRRIVLVGVGRNVLERDEERTARIIAGVDGSGDPDDNIGRLFAQYASSNGNDRAALLALLRRPARHLFTAGHLASVSCPVLVVLGDRDDAGPADPLVAALPDVRLTVLRNTDHFATPESFGFIDAALEFLDAVPA